MIELTIIVPVYNVEKYINKCLDSLLIAPELMNTIEVLIINDGTLDRSAELSRMYAERYPGSFRQIDKENAGHGCVWSLGLKEARGKYTRFLDSDDWLENLDVLIKHLENCDADLVLTPTLCHCANDELWKLEIKDMEFGKVYNADSFDWLHNRSHKNYVLHHSCTYKTEILRQYLPLFLEKQPYDDMILSPAAIIGADSLVAYDFVVYHYLMDREGQSISKSVQNRNIEAKIKSQQAVIDFIESHPVSAGSSKDSFFRRRLPKMYNLGYKAFLNLPYKEAKKQTAIWNSWTIRSNPSVQTKWIWLYRTLPFVVYRIIGRLIYK